MFSCNLRKLTILICFVLVVRKTNYKQTLSHWTISDCCNQKKIFKISSCKNNCKTLYLPQSWNLSRYLPCCFGFNSYQLRPTNRIIGNGVKWANQVSIRLFDKQLKRQEVGLVLAAVTTISVCSPCAQPRVSRKRSKIRRCPQSMRHHVADDVSDFGATQTFLDRE